MRERNEGEPEAAADTSGATESALLDVHAATWRAARRRLDGHADAADIAQEVWLKLHARTGRLGNPAAYARRIAANLLVDRARREKTHGGEPVADDLPCGQPSPERQLIARDRLRRLFAAVDRLPPKCQQVFRLRKLDGLEQLEIAERLGISVNMVQKHLRRALADIADALKD